MKTPMDPSKNRIPLNQKKLCRSSRLKNQDLRKLHQAEVEIKKKLENLANQPWAIALLSDPLSLPKKMVDFFNYMVIALGNHQSDEAEK